MAAADRKITYTAAEVAELIRPLTQSVEALQKENAELKQKLEHMNEILANAQRARFGQTVPVAWRCVDVSHCTHAAA